MTCIYDNDFLTALPPKIEKVHRDTVEMTDGIIGAALRFAQTPGMIALLSGGSLDCARYHILGCNPCLTVTAKGTTVTLRHGGSTQSFEMDPFDALDHVLCRYHLNTPDDIPPISSGLLGYLSYDLKNYLETLPRTSVDDRHLPDLYMTLPTVILVHDKADGSTRVFSPQFCGESADEAIARIDQFKDALLTPPKSEGDVFVETKGQQLASPFTRTAYMDAVEAIRRYIIDGHVYQVNMSQRFQTAFDGDPFALFAKMYENNPAPFFAYVNAGEHQVLCTSPERFIKLEKQSIETRPIKGTRPRGKTPQEDEALKSDLKTSPKDDAELSMIVDLLRNDIGKVCAAGSVKVTKHKRLEAYENVYHLVSIVDGRLDDDKNSVDLLRATFPGGSITGCPKIRSMEIIDELEPVRRHIYTGSIGYLSFHDTMDLNIAIRTATVTDQHIYFSVGGGIVYDSDPEDEYEETLHKGKTLMGAIHGEGTEKTDVANIVWHNGGFKPSSDAMVSCDDEGFLYGYGFFETLRVERGRPILLDAHIARFNLAYGVYFDSPKPDLTWEEIVRQLIEQNGLSDQTARCKILAAAGKPGAKYPGTLLVTVAPAKHRLEGTGRDGLKLVVYPHRRHSVLADYKTMNYMFYKTAGKFAASKQADESIVLNADGTVSETNTANILCFLDDQVICPASPHVLPGTMLRAVVERLKARGMGVSTEPVSIDRLRQASYLFLTNALMGLTPVMQLDDLSFEIKKTLCQEINREIFNAPR